MSFIFLQHTGLGWKHSLGICDTLRNELTVQQLPSVHLKQMGMQLYASLLRRAIIETGSVEEVYLPTIDALIKISKEQEEKLSEFQSFFLSRCVLTDLCFTAQSTLILIRRRLSEMFEGTGDEIEQKGMAMHADLRQLVSLLKEFDTIPEGIEWDDERTVATLKLMVRT